MLKTVKAKIEKDGNIYLLEPINVGHACDAIVTVMEEPEIPETALLSEDTLAQDWERPEEDEAWSHLQQDR
mgnify:FL=1